MICKKCRSARTQKHSDRKRMVTTLNGVVEIRYGYYYCLICKKHFDEDHKTAPTKSRYGWDVIEAICNLARLGYSGVDIVAYFKSYYELQIASSQVSDIKRRWMTIVLQKETA